MLNIGLSELLLVVVAALLILRPKDYPVVIRAVAKAMREFRAFIEGVRGQMDGALRDAGLHDLKGHITGTITDLEGKAQPTYDISDLTGSKPNAPTDKADA